MDPQLPSKSSSPTPESVKQLHDGLTSVISGHPGAAEPWTFYEILDDYLGPWGDRGYPIGYGKYYCIAFNGNKKLESNPQTRSWVRETTVALQEPLRDFVIERYRAGTLAGLTEDELRAFAFAVHPKAYVQGGLSTVVLTAPELLPIIATIPAAEFNPLSGSFGATIAQVLKTMEMVLPQTAGMSLAALMPAHSGLLQIATDRDRRNAQQEMAQSRWISEATRQLNAGTLDNIAALDQLTTRLNATRFADGTMVDAARRLVAASDDRKRKLAAYYRNQVTRNPKLAPKLDQLQPGWRNW